MVWDRLPTHGRGDAHHAAKPVLQPAFWFAHPRTAWPSETILIRDFTNTYAAFPVILRGIRRNRRKGLCKPTLAPDGPRRCRSPRAAGAGQ